MAEFPNSLLNQPESQGVQIRRCSFHILGCESGVLMLPCLTGVLEK